MALQFHVVIREIGHRKAHPNPRIFLGSPVARSLVSTVFAFSESPRASSRGFYVLRRSWLCVFLWTVAETSGAESFPAAATLARSVAVLPAFTAKRLRATPEH